MAKPRKVEEPAGTYSVSPKRPAQPLAPPAGPPAKPSAEAAVRRADHATFRKAANKVFKTHDDLFRKLAQ